MTLAALAVGCAMVLVGASCQRASRASSDEPSKLESPESPSSASTLASVAIQGPGWQVKPAVDSFRLATSEEDRRKAYLALLAALDALPDLAQAPEYSRFRDKRIEALVHDVAAAQERDRADEETLANAPVKPEYDPPKYTGAHYLEGAVKRCYGDGVAIESGSKYYFLRNEPCPALANILQGYVEDGIDTVQIDVGRDGRQAIVVDVRDKETADDDRAQHRVEVTEYQRQYQQSLVEFRVALKARNDLLAQTQVRAARTEGLRVAAEKLDQLLVALAKGPVAAAAVEDAAESLASEPAPDTRVEQKPSATRDRAVQQAAPKIARRSPMACMKGCIASCRGEADCERRCVAQQCR